MASHGGSRNRSGPKKQEGSATSDRLGYSLTALPASGYTGTPPAFPLPKRSVYSGEGFDDAETERTADREAELWAWLWTTPQACAWSMPSEAWRLQVIGLYVRTFVICESGGATAADKGSLHRFADQIGMTTAGLAEMGWKVAVDAVAEKRVTKEQADTPAPSRERRLRVAGAES